MNTPASTDTHTQGPAAHRPQRPACPRCHGLTERVPRHTLDFVVSVLLPVRRYRCVAIGCDWEGSLLKPREVQARDPRSDAISGRRPYL